jgi:hypothetical protein
MNKRSILGTVAGIEGLKFLLTDYNGRGNRLSILSIYSELPSSTAMPLSHTGAHVTENQIIQTNCNTSHNI